MSHVLQAKGGANSSLAKALAAGTLEEGSASGRTSDKGGSPSRSRSPPKAVPRHAVWKRDIALSRSVGRSPRSPKDSGGAHRNHVRDLFLQNMISGLEALSASVAAQASGARGCVRCCAGAGHYGRWKGNLARDARRVFLKDVDKPNVYWARIPCKDLATGTAKTATWHLVLLVH